MNPDKKEKQQDCRNHTKNLGLYDHSFRFIFFAICILTCSVHATGQVINANNKKTDSLKHSRTLLPDSVIEKKLEELALKNPAFESAKHQNKINEYQLKNAKNSWLNLLTISTNYNDQSFAKKTPQTTYVYPKYFFGLNIPLGTVLSKTAVKSAKEQVEISKDNEELLSRAIKADIVSKFKQYKTLNELIFYQRQVVDNYQVAFNEATTAFSGNRISIDVYNIASKNYNDELTKLINLQLQQDLLEIEMEKIIGTPLENVLYTN